MRRRFTAQLSEPEDVDRLTTLTAPERGQPKTLWHLVDRCASETFPISFIDELIATGWPDQIAPTAKVASQMSASRDVFSEEGEKDEPSEIWPR